MIFVDTSAWYALEVEDDENHVFARDFREELQKGRHGALLTSDYILNEVVTLLNIRKDPKLAVGFAEKVFRSKSVIVVWIERQIFDEALRLLNQRADKRWSFTDCTSFTIMSQLKVAKAFAFDKNFEQAGYTMLPA